MKVLPGRWMKQWRRCRQAIYQRLKRWSPARRDRLEALRRRRASRQLDRLVAALEEQMLTLPSGYERRQCNNELFRIRMMRAMGGI